MTSLNITDNGRYRWYIMVLVCLTATFVFAMPMMSLPVLFKEIATDLHLSLVQIGTVWGMIPLAGMFVVLAGGLLADKFGSKRMLAVGCLLAGLAGILRGLADSFVTLMLTMFLFGLLMTITGPGMIKAISVWFSGRRLGLANGILSMCMGLGFMLGALISATVLSPLLGGWRNVMFFYGGLSILVSILWFFSRSEASEADISVNSEHVPFRETMKGLLRNKAIWLLALIMVGQISCVQGMLGYLPLYLHKAGWTTATADGALSAFNAASTICAIPISLISDRLRTRKPILVTAVAATALGAALLGTGTGWAVWLFVIISGMVRDGFMSVHQTMVVETDGVGARNAGAAIGIIQTVAQFGSFVSPPVGNSLASINPGLPFFFWSGLAVAALFFIIPLRPRTRAQRHQHS